MRHDEIFQEFVDLLSKTLETNRNPRTCNLERTLKTHFKSCEDMLNRLQMQDRYGLKTYYQLFFVPVFVLVLLCRCIASVLFEKQILKKRASKRKFVIYVTKRNRHCQHYSRKFTASLSVVYCHKKKKKKIQISRMLSGSLRLRITGLAQIVQRMYTIASASSPSFVDNCYGGYGGHLLDVSFLFQHNRLSI